MRVLFWGTPDFASPSLRALLGEGYDVVGVVTQPDRPQGRHRSVAVASPVKHIALEEDITLLQPDLPRGDGFLASMRALEPDISVVIAYGHILSPDVIATPPLGTFNVHASLLPRWRGAAPIQAAILEGDAETGVSLMRMVAQLDAGPVILQAPTPILEDETFGELHLRLSELAALAIVEGLALVGLGDAAELEQDASRVTVAPKIDRERTRIDWTADAERVARVIRAFDPRPGAFSPLRSIDVKFFGGRYTRDAAGDPGGVLAIDESGMLVACGSGGVRISHVQPEGKRRLAALELAQGRGLIVGDHFGA